MLLPFQFAILTIEEATTLVAFIEQATSTPKCDKNYKKIHEMGMAELYGKLKEFIEENSHYYGQLKYFHEDNFKRSDYD